MLRKCKYCGLEAHTEEQLELFDKDIKSKHGRMNRCKSCNNKRTTLKKNTIKLESIQYLGGKCSHCGTVGTLDNSCIFDFHHLDPDTKSYTIGSHSNNLEEAKPELDKCIVLCANCHRMEHRHGKG